MDTAEYLRYDALGLAELVATGEVSAAELLALARERAAAVNPRINAIVREMRPEADARAAGTLTGPFAGVPFLIKDLAQDYAGVPTSSGCRALSTRPAGEHATVVQRWLDAGLVIFGKTNCPEFGAKGITEPDLFGPARNPWALGRTPGGSTRIPAACCGLVGLKPGRGLLPMGPAEAEVGHGAAVQGVVSRTVRDTAAMLDVLAGGEPSGPYEPAMPTEPFAAQVGADPGRLTIGVRVPTEITPKPHPQARAAADAAVRALRELGHSVEILTAAPYDDAQLAKDFLLCWFVHVAWEVAEARRASGAGDEGFERDTLIMAALGRATSGVDYLASVQRRHQHTRRLTTFFETHDLLLTPTLAKPPPLIGEFNLPAPLQRVADALLKTRTARVLSLTKIVDDMVDQNLGWVPYTQLANLTGRPAISLPLHWSADGVPLGVQFVAPLGGEGRLIRLAAQLEEALPWRDRRPAL
jgi:amidase